MEQIYYLNESELKITEKHFEQKNDKYSRYFIKGEITGTLIEKPIDNRSIKINHLETYDEYLKIDQTKLDKEWIYNIIDHKAETNDIIYEDDNIILIPDYKWDKDIRNLHILGIFKDKELYSIRELEGKHIGMLERSVEKCKEIINDEYGINKMWVFFHYHPSVWQLHLHFMNIECESKTYSLPRSHLVSTVIENLKISDDYYKKVKLEILK